MASHFVYEDGQGPQLCLNFEVQAVFFSDRVKAGLTHLKRFLKFRGAKPF
jgi:hypothetical protein